MNLAIAKEVASGAADASTRAATSSTTRFPRYTKRCGGRTRTRRLLVVSDARWWMRSAYIARRAVRMAVEDIGLADPRAFAMTLDAWEAYDRLGSPEGELAIANAVVYLACAPKSNAVYVAVGEAKADVEQFGTLDVPLRFATRRPGLMKNLGYGQGYRYAHEEPDAFAAGERYLPDEMPDRRYYRPVAAGLEIEDR